MGPLVIVSWMKLGGRVRAVCVGDFERLFSLFDGVGFVWMSGRVGLQSALTHDHKVGGVEGEPAVAVDAEAEFFGLVPEEAAG